MPYISKKSVRLYGSENDIMVAKELYPSMEETVQQLLDNAIDIAKEEAEVLNRKKGVVKRRHLRRALQLVELNKTPAERAEESE